MYAVSEERLKTDKLKYYTLVIGVVLPMPLLHWKEQVRQYELEDVPPNWKLCMLQIWLLTLLL
jgi:hypothetical protein